MPSIHSLQKLLSITPNDAFLLYAIAQEHSKAGNYTGAVEHFDKCLAADAKYCYAYYHKALALSKAGDLPEAIRTLQEGELAATQAGDTHAFAEMQSLRLSLADEV